MSACSTWRRRAATKVADFQNFAKSFAFGDYADADGLDRRQCRNPRRRRRSQGPDAATARASPRPSCGRCCSQSGRRWRQGDPKRGVTILKTEYAADYWQRRQKLIGLAAYVAAKTKRTRPEESAAAHELAEALKLDRV